MKTASFESKKYYTKRIFNLTFSIYDISILITFRFCRDWEFRAMKIQAQEGVCMDVVFTIDQGEYI
jgi:hypothetical protein